PDRRAGTDSDGGGSARWPGCRARRLPSLLLRLGRRGRRGAAALCPLAGVVAPDEITREIEVGLGEHQRRLVEDHAEVLGGGDLADDPGHALEDLPRRLLLLGRQVLLVANVG